MILKNLLDIILGLRDFFRNVFMSYVKLLTIKNKPTAILVCAKVDLQTKRVLIMLCYV